ncbi:alanine--tRNA ligase [Amphritea sp. 1_MG-2023]|uniref:alanine--tRNA ligase n=1 Tax=Amphritea sp. 1_MG-2023 TaxID=3062670 RepID=UPI0026E1F529|nr:alanine--tRNA ligase [Amphritea sp. 1_MG-2023]MDO6562657.1 alanine--tRNA ligase [Amphritea sp. 1_MG-2023]
MTSAELRQAFLGYFQSQGHEIVESSSLIPANDPTLMFTNAGMVQFKDVFLGSDKRAYSRATTSQRCVRAGGKHNDLDNVGYTARHHTFFEMLGNFSFGDYFKREAIQFAWHFLTEVLELPKEKLWVTVHISDDEAEKIWKDEMGIDPERFSKLDEDNFWSMGDTGPCGPSSEIFYDHGADVWGGPPGSPEEDGDRYIEIWNLVFMQFNRSADGVMAPLPKPSVDTGMGLERIAAVLQGVHSNYEIDLFQNLLKAASVAVGCQETDTQSLRVIADHIRSCAFLICDDVIPSNEGAGYVLRRIIRRAVRHGNKLGATGAFFHTLVAALTHEMGDAYPELQQKQAQVERVLLKEEEQFAKTLDHGLRLLEEVIATLTGTEIPGETVFKLYDTYGFPVDLTADVAREHQFTVDMDGFDRAMEEQRNRARAAGKFNVDYNATLQLEGQTEFTGYTQLEGAAKVVALFCNGVAVEQLNAGDNGMVVLDQTPFYGESGGQVGDTGVLTAAAVEFRVDDCTKEAKNHLHHGVLTQGCLAVGDTVMPQVNAAKRRATAVNHSATHILHEALRQVLGDHVQQKGSLCDAERLRFDFSHFEAVKPAELQQIEQICNEQIRLNSVVQTDIMDLETAKQTGAAALFGEKYEDTVRVLTMGDGFSVELCGGTHANRTGDIALLKITSEGGIAAGVRRIEALTGAKALAYINASAEQLEAKLQEQVDKTRQLEKVVEQMKTQLAAAKGADLLGNAVNVKGIKVLAEQLDGVDPKALRDTIDQLKNKLGSGVVVLATVADGKVSLAAGVTKDLTKQVKAGDLVRNLTAALGGKGGGRPDFAQGGGTDTDALPKVLETVQSLVEDYL